MPPGLISVAAGGEVRRRIGHVLDDLHVEHHVEALARRREALRRAVPVVDGEARLRRVQRGDGDVARRRVDAGDLGAEPRHRLGEEPAAAADVEEPEAGEGPRRLRVATELGRDLVDDVVEPAGVQHVQRLELALRIPPLGGHRLELGDLGGVNRTGDLRCTHSANLRLSKRMSG